MTSRQTGDKGEDFVCCYLSSNNYEIVKRNYTIKGGEIDIIAVKGEIVAFVEVKTRALNALVSGYDAITKQKKMHIFRTAQHYYINSHCSLQPRFDVAVVETDHNDNMSIDYIENAFDMSDTNIYF